MVESLSLSPHDKNHIFLFLLLLFALFTLSDVFPFGDVILLICVVDRRLIRGFINELYRAARRIGQHVLLPAAHSYPIVTNLDDAGENKNIADELYVQRERSNTVERCNEWDVNPSTRVHLHARKDSRKLQLSVKGRTEMSSETHPLPQKEVLRHILRAEIVFQLTK